MEPSENKDRPMETGVSDELHKPHVPWIPSDGSSSDSSAGDDEWRPCRRKQTRKVNPLRSQATKLIWKRRKAAALLLQKQMAQESGAWSSSRPQDSASTSSLAQAASLVPPTQSAQRPAARAVSGPGPTPPPLQGVKASWQRHRVAKLCLAHQRDRLSRVLLCREAIRYPICWSDTTLGSSLPGKGSKSPLKAKNSGKAPRTSLSTSPRKGKVPLEVRHAQPLVDAWGMVQGAGRGEEPPCHNGELACRPKLFSSAEDGEPPPGYERLRGPGREPGVPSRPKLRPTLLRRKNAVVASKNTQVGQYSPLGPSPHRGAKMDAAPTMVATRAMPRMLSRGNYATHSELAEHGSGVPISVATSEAASTASLEATAEAEAKMCTKRSRMSLAAKLRWEQRRAKMNFAATSADRRQEAPTAARQEMCCAVEISVASQRPKAVGGHSRSLGACKLPAKLRFKRSNSADCAMPAKLRLKQERLLQQLDGRGGDAAMANVAQVGDSSASLPTAPRTVAGTPKPGTPKPGTPKPGTPKLGTPKPGTPKAASASSIRRSEAKRRWWQRLRQLTAGTGTSRDVPGECTAAVLHSFPKFLQAELFAEAKRRSDTEGAKEGVVAAPSGSSSSSSRRSAAMKENWRRRKQTWLSAAAEALAAANRPTSLAGQPTGVRPVDRLDCTLPAQQNGQRLAQSLALWRCRQRRRHAVCGQVYASESTSLSKEYLKGWSQNGGVAPSP
ncbi:uncharacterized protein LOC8034064 isoform X1 [Ixodes scapularis]|uniref:uncharacterized protein LOC8034064 isoform X1 n=1 Tax=Ixodes scapularis TaxID=6945 RepID=UPI001C389929|nr:uncharacterized protein LOC8034064 isoform X1 [Ixodes scapularis]